MLPTCPNRLALGSQKIRSKHSTTLFRFPKPSRWIAATFQSGKGGMNCTVFGTPWVLAAVHCFNTPNGNVHSTASPESTYISWLSSGNREKDDEMGEACCMNGGGGDEYRISVGPLRRSKCGYQDNIKTRGLRNWSGLDSASSVQGTNSGLLWVG